MKYSKTERIKIGKEIYESGMSFIEAGVTYGISDETARRYQIIYEKSSGVSHHSGNKIPPVPSLEVQSHNAEPLASTLNYEDMTKKELIQELMKAKIREARLKKGYMVRGCGASREFVLLSKGNTK